ncbi:MAG: hypothetical protein OHK93_008131 [Ramalina farinacea]|uniref:Uncharacterized protein n=1 Tax=Ramalina farinacea TaxID=258253 RepID=A0AA43QR54_9LECA|nr:hypothetical protein [Ramalina farinacea]
MSMSRISPTANLLRSSRLFALPPQVAPRSSSDAGAIRATADSDTATLPHPIHAAIETSESALGRGDWGLKRSLPLKSTTKPSSPNLFIENIDSIDHITDFGSANDHTRTLEKWQETALSLSRYAQNDKEALSSVFESKTDNTYAANRASAKNRWKFRGPWLAGQSRGDFDDYVQKRLRKKIPGFREYLRRILLSKKMADQRQAMLEEEGFDTEAQEITITDSELDEFIKQLRKNTSTSRLEGYVQDFLDLPREESQRASQIHQDIQTSGPPATHPSAGLSYLRSHSHTFNHPTYGPQDNKPPVQARVLAPQEYQKGRKRSHAVFGIAGVVANDSRATFTRSVEEDDVAILDPDKPGGGKVWLQLRKATINPQGRIELGNQRAERNALHAAGIEQPPNAPAAASPAPNTLNMPDQPPSRVRYRHGQTYGLESMGVPKREKPKPFNDESDLMDVMGKVFKQK